MNFLRLLLSFVGTLLFCSISLGVAAAIFWTLCVLAICFVTWSPPPSPFFETSLWGVIRFGNIVGLFVGLIAFFSMDDY